MGPAAILDTRRWSPFSHLFFPDISPTEVSALTGLEDLQTQLMSVRFDVHVDGAATETRSASGFYSRADFYERDGYDAAGSVDGGYILWIGAAFPSQPTS